MAAWTSDQLRTLLAVVDEGTFDAAAARLHVTPSAVSQRIKALERATGQVLLRRTTPVTATAAGHLVVRHAREVDLLDVDLARQLGDVGRDGEAVTLAIAVNADSLATWFLPALTGLGPRADLVFDLRRADQDLTADLLRAGDVAACVTSLAAPVQGARSTPLGVMRYLPVCSLDFAAHHLADRPPGQALRAAPFVDFDRADDLQRQALRRGTGAEPRGPRHYVPTSADFARAVIGGLGWGLLPEQQCLTELDAGELVLVDGVEPVDVALWWQRWTTASALLDEVSDAVISAARAALRPMPSWTTSAQSSSC